MAPDCPEDRDERAISAATLDRTAKLLMQYIGPIAAVLVRKTAANARNEADLHASLAERIHDAGDRARFMADVAEGPHR